MPSSSSSLCFTSPGASLCQQFTGLQAEMQGFHTKALFNIHFCVHNTSVYIKMPFIESICSNRGLIGKESIQSLSELNTLSEHDTLAWPNTRLQKRVILHPCSLKANIQLLTLHSSLQQQKDCMMEKLSHLKISHLQNSFSTKE